MIDDIKKSIDNHEVISFDIFDTLLFRKVPHPQDVFTIIEQKYQLKNFKQKRIKAEIIARKNSKNIDVTLQEIYYQLDNIDIEYELKEERALLFANPEFVEIYNYAISLKKKVICISDMYLDKIFLRDILVENGFDKIEDIYVSSLYKNTKVQGGLYEQVLKTLDLKYTHDLLHIGDNYHSDVKMALSYGINALHYNKKYFDKSCWYKTVLMKDDISSLYVAQKIRHGEHVEENIKMDNLVLCHIKWGLYKLYRIYQKCHIFGVGVCVNKVKDKILYV